MQTKTFLQDASDHPAPSSESRDIEDEADRLTDSHIICD